MHVQFPLFEEGKRSGYVSQIKIQGRVQEEPGGSVIYIPMKEVQAAVKDAPATTTSTILGITKKTYVTFTTLCASKDE